MKRVRRLILVAALVVGLAPACSRRDAEEQAEARAAAAAEQAQAKQRADWFGAAATSPDITWRANGLGSRLRAEGAGPKPGLGTPVQITYVGKLKDGTVFDRADKPVSFQIGSTIPGLSAGLQMLGTGGKAEFYIPPSLGYGARKVMGIPPNSGLIFEVEVHAVNP